MAIGSLITVWCTVLQATCWLTGRLGRSAATWFSSLTNSSSSVSGLTCCKIAVVRSCSFPGGPDCTMPGAYYDALDGHVGYPVDVP